MFNDLNDSEKKQSPKQLFETIKKFGKFDTYEEANNLAKDLCIEFNGGDGTVRDGTKHRIRVRLRRDCYEVILKQKIQEKPEKKQREKKQKKVS